MSRRKNFLIVILIIVLAAVGFVIYKKPFQSKTNGTSQVTGAKVVNLDGEEGKTVYDILKSKHQIEEDKASFGVMIKSIDGVKSTDKEFWTFSVNGKPAEVAADKFATHTGDKIVWEYKGM